METYREALNLKTVRSMGETRALTGTPQVYPGRFGTAILHVHFMLHKNEDKLPLLRLPVTRKSIIYIAGNRHTHRRAS